MADQSKTEQATQKRQKKARDDGQFPAAREFVSALQFCIFLGLLGAGGPAWFASFRATARSIFMMPFSMKDLQPQDVTHLAWQIFLKHVAPLLVAGLIVAAGLSPYALPPPNSASV
jgi:flagellar biosynthesis protein FlhB